MNDGWPDSAATAPRTPRPTGKSSSSPIGFRLDALSRRVLVERAEQLGISPHELARHYVLELLGEAEERSALREAVTDLHLQLTQVRADLALSIQALLTSAGKVPAAEAAQWVEENFPSPPQPPRA